MGTLPLLKHEILCYSLSHLSSTEKVRFFYALKGRGKQEGIISKYEVRQLSKGVLLAKESRTEEVKSFLRYWHCPIKITEVYLHD
ncbi:MAG TPA: hypothetical protein VJH22_02825 [Candidatus Nanoarchaeia archaeon]|nr:hypothetical protein [Candidatus Nanoarchaeia archaeon]